MKIKKLHLHNIKSYQDETLTFYDGVNFISGLNGAGKSTVIESIGYALFDCKPGTLAEFVRYGAKTGVINVEFEANDGRLYRVVRKTGNVSSWLVYDGRTGAEIDLHGASDIKPWLKECLGIEQEQDLAQLFSDVIGVGQGTFTAPFLDTAAGRKLKFNKMLKVEAYNEAFTRSRELVAALNQRSAEQEMQKARLEASIADYDQVKNEVAELKPYLAGLEEELLIKRQELAALAKARDELKAVKAALEQASRDAAVLSVEVQNLARLNRQSQDELVKAREAAAKTTGARSGYLVYLTAQQSAGELEKKRLERDQLRQRQSEVSGELKSQTASLEAGRKALQLQLGETARELQDRQAALTGKEAEVKKALAAKDAVAVLDGMLKNISAAGKDCRKEYDELAELVRRMADGQDKWAALEEQLEEVNRRLAREEALAGEVAAVKAWEQEAGAERLKLAALAQKLETIEANSSQAAGGLCPFLQAPCQNVGGDLSAYFAARQAETEALLENSKKIIGDLEQKIRAGQQALQLQQELAAEHKTRQYLLAEQQKYLQAFGLLLAKAGRSQLANQAGLLGEGLAALHQEMLRLLGSESTAEWWLRFRQARELLLAAWEDCRPAANDGTALTMELVNNRCDKLLTLQDKAGAMLEAAAGLCDAAAAVITAAAAQRAAKAGQAAGEQQLLEQQVRELEAKKALLEQQEKELQDKRQALAALQTEQGTLEEKLAHFTGLDLEIRQKQAELEANRPSYELYMRYEEEARKVAPLLEQLRSIESGLAEKQASLQVLQDRQEKLQSVFSEELLQQQEQDLERRQAEAAKLAQLLEEREKNLTEKMQKLAAMEQTRAEIDRLQQKIEQTGAVRAMLDFIRSIFNRAGERVAAVYREYLAHEADRLYREVARENLALEWRDDYEVVLVDTLQGRKRERSFKQLSGGEQMTAALAVRLALLGQLSGVKLGFFDEPTTNLDGERRGNLAQIIPRVTGDFEQLFVISHDDSFEAMTDNIILLEKDQGEGTRRR